MQNGEKIHFHNDEIRSESEKNALLSDDSLVGDWHILCRCSVSPLSPLHIVSHTTIGLKG